MHKKKEQMSESNSDKLSLSQALELIKNQNKEIFQKKTKKEIEIDVNEFYPLPKDKISMISGISFTGNKIVKKTSFSLTQHHHTFVVENAQLPQLGWITLLL